MTDSVFNTQMIDNSPPKNAWDWDAYYNNTLYDPDLLQTQQTISSDYEMNKYVQDQKLSWNDSPKQLEISFLTGNTTNFCVPKSTTEESSSLTEPNTQNDDVFPADNLVIYYGRLYRRNTFREKRLLSKVRTLLQVKSSNNDTTSAEDCQPQHCRPVIAHIDLTVSPCWRF